MKRLRNATPQRDLAAAAFGPAALEITSRTVVVDDMKCATFAVAGYPREVSRGWLEPLLSSPYSVDVSVHIEPMDRALAANRLRKQLARLESSRRADASDGRLIDYEVDAAADDASRLARQIARGDSRLFRVGISVTVRATDDKELTAATSHVRATLSSLLAELRPMTFRAFEGWMSSLPLGIDGCGLKRTFDTPAVAATFPFPAAGLSDPSGVLYGRNAGSGAMSSGAMGSGLVFWDRFALDNHNSVILARSGAGKSYLAKLEILRSLYRGIEVAVVDPEDEYQRLAQAVDGKYLKLGAPGVQLNPFDLGPGNDALTRQALFIHSLIGLLLGTTLSGTEKAALDRAIIAAYATAGITSDPRTHRRAAPTLGDLSKMLVAQGAKDLAVRLSPYVDGSFSGLFSGPTTRRPEGHLVVYSLRDLPEEMRVN